MTELRADLPPLPARMASLPRDHRGFPVPWFVAWIDGVADFRVIGPGKISDAVRRNVCWLCGQPRGIHNAFIIGPMCAINRTISEPPSHLECAEFAVRACPFLTQPRMRRNDKDIPADSKEPAGVGLKRNPGVACIWVTKEFRLMKVDNGVLFRLGDPERVLWFAEGRTATREEVAESIRTGLPLLMEPAMAEGAAAVQELRRLCERARTLLPASAAE